MKKKAKQEAPDIQRWYNHGMGAATIVDRLVNEYGYTLDGAAELVEEIIYG
jgi:hypothetical protein